MDQSGQHGFEKSTMSSELLDVPASFQDRLDPDIGSGSHVSGMLDDVRFSLYLNPARGPGFHSLEIIHNERGSRILKHVLVLHSVHDVSTADIDVLTISIKADSGNIWPSRLGRCPDSS